MTAKENLLRYLSSMIKFVEDNIPDDTEIIGITRFQSTDATNYITADCNFEEIISKHKDGYIPDEYLLTDRNIIGFYNKSRDELDEVEKTLQAAYDLYCQVYDKDKENFKEADEAFCKKVSYINVDI